VELAGRLRSDRVMRLPAPPRRPGTNGRPRKHGRELALSDPATWPDPQIATSTVTSRYGTAVAAAWDRVHPRLTRRAAWLDHDGDLPVIEGTLIRLQVEHLPGDRDPKPVWLWWSRTGAAPADVDRCWQSFLRRFDLEHTYRLFKQVLGWTAPKIRDPAAADRWTWLIIAAHAQLRLARPLAAGLRRPWERPSPPGRLTPARVRRGFRNIRAKTAQPASAPKPGKPGPGRPPARGSATRHHTMTWEKRRKGAHAQGTSRTRRLNSKLRTESQVLAGRQAGVSAFPAGVLDQVIRHGVADELAHASPSRAKSGGGAVQLAGGIGHSLLEPVFRRLGQLLAGAITWRGSPQQVRAERGAGAEPGHIQRRRKHRPRVRISGLGVLPAGNQLRSSGQGLGQPVPPVSSATDSRRSRAAALRARSCSAGLNSGSTRTTAASSSTSRSRACGSAAPGARTAA
jgi:hypothetical protein